MKKQRIIFRADASKKVGYGHFIRSLALAGYLKDNFNCVFASFNEDSECGGMTDYQLKEIGRICTPADAFGLILKDFDDAFIELLESGDIVVLDNYYYDTAYQRRIKDKGCKLVCVDDMHQFHMVCDMVITGCPLRREDFSLDPDTKFVGGIEWAFLREPFLTPVNVRNIPKQIKRVVMAMGGADAFCLTDKMIEIILSVMSGVELDVICGDKATVTGQYNSNIRVHRRLSADDIVQLLDTADIGVFPASTICIEAFSRRLPVIAGYYVKNQYEFYEYGTSHSYFSGIGNLLDDAAEIKERLEIVLTSKPPRPVVIDFTSQKKKIVELFKSL